MDSIPVHVVSGFLGAGKTTFLLRQLETRAGLERCAVVVNDFGEASLDATVLGQHADIREIPGGCICCTAPEGLIPALSELIASYAPDRIFIETTGLARPADVVDTVSRSGLERVVLAPTVVLVDPERFHSEPPALLLEQLASADVLVANRTDLSSPEALASLKAWVEKRYPPVAAFHVVSEGRLPKGGIDVDRTQGAKWFPMQTGASTEEFGAESRIWGPEKIFDMGQLKALYQEVSSERIKGIFRTDLGFYSIQWAGGQIDVRPSPVRSGSRVDIIGERDRDFGAWLDAVEAADFVAPDAEEIPAVNLVDAGGWNTPLTRAALAALPKQVPDVSLLVPGREGVGVLLSEVLALAGAAPSCHFVVVASDGMTTQPIPLSQAGEAILVHGLNSEDYPAEKGGPFRIFVPPGEGRSACSNVKKVVRIVVSQDG